MRHLCWIYLLTLFLLAACSLGASTAAEPDIFFPRQNAIMTDFPLALIEGEMYVANDCLYARHTSPDDIGYLLIWPMGYTLEEIDGEYHVFDRSGELVAQTNAPLRLGGGLVPLDHIEPRLEAPVPETCQDENTWLVADTFRELP